MISSWPSPHTESLQSKKSFTIFQQSKGVDFNTNPPNGTQTGMAGTFQRPSPKIISWTLISFPSVSPQCLFDLSKCSLSCPQEPVELWNRRMREGSTQTRPVGFRLSRDRQDCASESALTTQPLSHFICSEVRIVTKKGMNRHWSCLKMYSKAKTDNVANTAMWIYSKV